MEIPELPNYEDARVKIQENWKIEKRDAAGELFEVVEGGTNKPTRVVYRREGEPPESYARGVPYVGET